VGLLHKYQDGSIDIYKGLRKIASSTPAIVIYLFIISVTVYFPMVNNYFTGDDFTWFRWAASCGNPHAVLTHCSPIQALTSYFTDSQGFFYRPGTKTYFYGMYQIFWLN